MSNNTPNNREVLLELKNLCVSYQGKTKQVHAVKNTDLTVYRGDSLGIVGESGSGKSTLALAVLRLLPERVARVTGEVNFMGQDLLSLDRDRLKSIRWNNLSVVFQKAMNSFSPVHRIGEQVEDIYRVHNPGATKAEVFNRVSSLLKLVNLGDQVYNLYPHEMSGGMIQRVSIAVSLLHDPDLLIFDEATTALDVITQRQILKEITAMEKDLNMSRIMITHDISVVASSCKKIAVMYAGEIMEEGMSKDVLKNPMHPYTKGLLASFPALRGEKKALKAIKGFLPDLSIRHEGCIFSPRCEAVHDKCRLTRPEPLKMSDGRMVACTLYNREQSP
ncbi:MAG: ABC transporter ATP-binding protein [Treponema sp.]|nr:ABC transporter ATP-binding protein [Treponema sp.]